MEPSDQQIEKRAYERWERRGWRHGGDLDDWVAARMDLSFELNYRTIVEIEHAEIRPQPAGAERRPRCRFCEQSAPRVSFSFVRPILPEFLGSSSPTTREICDGCYEEFQVPLDRELALFWSSLGELVVEGHGENGRRPPSTFPIPAYKCLSRIALSMMPESELPSFNDTIEWIVNPDHEFDGGLFGGVSCVLYRTHASEDQPWASLARRSDRDAPYPYMLFFLGLGRTILQAFLPLCPRDEDHDGEGLRLPRRSFTTGSAGDLCAAQCVALPLGNEIEPVRGRRLGAS
ncbi:DUF2934 domain-containing protein [Aquisphaera insulae]|uniref:DUF2934 domain-containing protein n=1 Tax=Aquisphaera insulae TaxID=2712864 RepID=UPI0013EA9894|nr:DUF2934 domain-containing protein [Aquisphaera insulae]